MIKSRIAQPADVPRIYELLGIGSNTPPERAKLLFDPDRDMCSVATLDGHVQGVVLARPVVLCHGLSIDAGPTARHMASQLLHYGKGIIRGNDKMPQEMVIIVDPENERAQAYFEDAGAVKDRPGVIYFLGVD